MERLSRAIFYLASFGLARGGLFVAPIVLALWALREAKGWRVN
jgi:hypothetical protein